MECEQKHADNLIGQYRLTVISYQAQSTNIQENGNNRKPQISFYESNLGKTKILILMRSNRIAQLSI